MLHVVFIARQPRHVHYVTFKTHVVFRISTTSRRPRSIHTFTKNPSRPGIFRWKSGELHIYVLSPTKPSQSGMWRLSSDVNKIYILSPKGNLPLNFQSVPPIHYRARYVKHVTGTRHVLRLQMEQTRRNTDDSFGYVCWITNRRRQTEVGNLASGLVGVLYQLTIRNWELYKFEDCSIRFESGEIWS